MNIKFSVGIFSIQYVVSPSIRVNTYLTLHEYIPLQTNLNPVTGITITGLYGIHTITPCTYTHLTHAYYVNNTQKP